MPRSTPPSPPEASNEAFEAEVLPGLEPWARAELVAGGAAVTAEREGEIAFEIPAGRGATLDGLRRTTAVYRRLRFDVPRPRSLLGDRHRRRWAAVVRDTAARREFRGFRFGAAGSDSPTFARLARAFVEATGLEHRPDDGELLVRVRPVPGGAGWDVLLRRTPRPLSARDWRACNRPGGLNACVAAAMVDASAPAAGDRFLNAMCGSGTLLVERALHPGARPARLVGFDLDWEALGCARDNLTAAGIALRAGAIGDGSDDPAESEGGWEGVSEGGLAAELHLADAGTSGLPDASFDVVAADPPWGDAVGDHERNAELYPRFLDEARRLLAPGGRLLLLSHEIRLVASLLESRREWRATLERKVFHGGHWPRLMRLERVD